MLNGLRKCFKQYRTTGFDSAKITANTISEDLDIEIEFKKPVKESKSYEGPDDLIIEDNLGSNIIFFFFSC